MTALTADRRSTWRNGVDFDDPVASDAVIYAGALVVLDADGNAVPGTSATGLTARGIAKAARDNSSGMAGDLTVPITAGTWQFDNAGDINRTHIGSDAYIVDDQTVSSDNSGRSIAGRIVDVDDDGVFVKIRI